MKRNLTLTLQPKIQKILDNMYEKGIINSRTEIVEMALLEWFINHHLIDLEDEVINKEKLLPLEAIEGLISALEDFKKGDYTILESGQTNLLKAEHSDSLENSQETTSTLNVSDKTILGEESPDASSTPCEKENKKNAPKDI